MTLKVTVIVKRQKGLQRSFSIRSGYIQNGRPGNDGTEDPAPEDLATIRPDGSPLGPFLPQSANFRNPDDLSLSKLGMLVPLRDRIATLNTFYAKRLCQQGNIH